MAYANPWFSPLACILRQWVRDESTLLLTLWTIRRVSVMAICQFVRFWHEQKSLVSGWPAKMIHLHVLSSGDLVTLIPVPYLQLNWLCVLCVACLLYWCVINVANVIWHPLVLSAQPLFVRNNAAAEIPMSWWGTQWVRPQPHTSRMGGVDSGPWLCVWSFYVLVSVWLSFRYSDVIP